MASRPQYISLFSGAGGLDLAARIAIPKARCVCFVEGEIPCAEILAARMEEGNLEDAPIWSDVRTFDGEPWRGKVDFIVGGFPCQDLSVAGKRAGIDGERSGLWSEYARIVGQVRPQFVFIENVPGLLANEPMRRVLGDLSALGFDAEWCSLPASGTGSPQHRERAWILASASDERLPGTEFCSSQSRWKRGSTPRSVGKLRGTLVDQDAGLDSVPVLRGILVQDSRGTRSGLRVSADRGLDRGPVFPPGWHEYDKWEYLLVRKPWLRPAISQAEIESALCELDDELADLVVQQRVDSLRALGNGVVALQGATALRLLLRRMMDDET